MQKSKQPTSKPVFKLNSPYSPSTWPDLKVEDENVIMDMLCSLLAPIGKFRTHVKPSKGVKSRRRRKRHVRKSKPMEQMVIDPPEIQSSLTVGLNSTTRHLEELAAYSSLSDLKRLPGYDTPGEAKTQEEPPLKHVELVFLPRPKHHVVHAHLPTLSLTASNAHPHCAKTRLIPLSADAEPKLAKLLGLPRVGVIGIIEGAPVPRPLIDYVTNHVQEVSVPWLDESCQYQSLQVQVTGIDEQTQST